MRHTILILIISFMMFMFAGCGRLDQSTNETNENGNGGGEDGEIISYQPKLVNGNILKDHKNPNVKRLNSEMLVIVYINKANHRIMMVLYDNYGNKLTEKTLYSEYAILDGRPGITRLDDERFAICFESLNGAYLSVYNKHGNQLIKDTKILEENEDDAMMESLNSKDILVVYEKDTNRNKNIYSKVIRIN
jgi:hypothetical protein